MAPPRRRLFPCATQGRTHEHGIHGFLALPEPLCKAKRAQSGAQPLDLIGQVDHQRSEFLVGVEGALSYSRDAYEVLSGTQAEVSKLLEASVANLNKNLVSVVDKAVKSAPAGSDVAVTALKSTMAATSAAIESMTKATRQVVDFTDASVRAASAKAATVAGSAAKTPAKKAA